MLLAGEDHINQYKRIALDDVMVREEQKGYAIVLPGSKLKASATLFVYIQAIS